MPAVITHYLSAQKALEKSSGTITKIVQNCPQVFALGTQGPDFFFFHPKGKKYPLTGQRMHHQGINKFFYEALDYSKERSSNEKELLAAYLLGFVSHYAVDTATHPYIYYHTGFSNSKGKLSFPYSYYHRLFETQVDVLLSDYYSGGFEKLHIDEKIKVNDRHLYPIAKMYAQVLPKAYGITLPERSIRQALHSIEHFYRHFKGKKKLVASLFGRSIGAMIHSRGLKVDMEALLEPKVKYHPWTDEELPPQSFMDLLNQGISGSEEYFKILYDYLYRGEDRLKELGDKNFSSGCEVDVPFLYFSEEFINNYLKPS